MKRLRFEIKKNQTKSPRIYVKCSKTKEIFGTFLSNDPDQFQSWDKLDEEARIELKQYMHNLKSVADNFGEEALDHLVDWRLRLPKNLCDAIAEIASIDDELDIYSPIMTSILQTIRVASVQNDGKHKLEIQDILEKHGFSRYEKLDFTNEIQAIFMEVNSLHNKSEKLHQMALELFNKDKSYSPRTLENIQRSEMKPAKWLVACAIAVLLEEKREAVSSMLTTDDLKMLLAKPLKDNDHEDKLVALIDKYQLSDLKAVI